MTNAQTNERNDIRIAIEYAPKSGAYAPGLRGVWTPEGWFVCAPCVGRITARGMGHLFHKAQRVWNDQADLPLEPVGVCCTNKCEGNE